MDDEMEGGFERALWGDPLMEHYFRKLTEDSISNSLLKGYCISYFSKDMKIRRILYNIYLYLIMTVECTYRHYEDEGQYLWAKEMLKEMVDLLKKIDNFFI